MTSSLDQVANKSCSRTRRATRSSYSSQLLVDTAAVTTVQAGPASDAKRSERHGSALEVLAVATRLGLTCFGGPIAHLGYFRQEYVVKRRWLDERSYADLVGLCQFLPGATSSKVGMSVGILRAGLPGGLAAWLGFTLPSAVMLVAIALVFQGLGAGAAGWLDGLAVVA